MTRKCASPEQLCGDPITTSSDVCQPGLLLYLPLSGRHAHDTAERTPAALARAVRECEPPAERGRGGSAAAGAGRAPRKSGGPVVCRRPACPASCQGTMAFLREPGDAKPDFDLVHPAVRGNAASGKEERNVGLKEVSIDADERAHICQPCYCGRTGAVRPPRCRA